MRIRLSHQISAGFAPLAMVIAMGVVTLVSFATALSVQVVQQEQQVTSDASTSCSSLTTQTSCSAVSGCSWKPEVKSNCSSLSFDSCTKTGCSKQWDNCSLDNCMAGCNYKEEVSTQKSCTLADCDHDGCNYDKGGKVITSASCKNWEGTGCSGLGESACKDKEKSTLCYWQPAIYSQPSCTGSYRVVTREASCTGQVNKRCEGEYVTTPAQCTGTPILRYTCSSDYQCIAATNGEFLDYGDCSTSCNPPTSTPVNKCTQGNSYCNPSNITQVMTCKTDKSGYTATACPSGQVCPNGGSSCVPRPTSTPTPTRSGYSCNANYQCVSQVGGEFRSLGECRDECVRPAGFAGLTDTCNSPAADCSKRTTRPCKVNGVTGYQHVTYSRCSYSSPFSCSEAPTNLSTCIVPTTPTPVIPTPTGIYCREMCLSQGNTPMECQAYPPCPTPKPGQTTTINSCTGLNEGERCLISGFTLGYCQTGEGGLTCVQAGPVGSTCTTDRECSSNLCIGGACKQGGLGQGQVCVDNSQCLTKNCVQASSGPKTCQAASYTSQPREVGIGGTCGTTSFGTFVCQKGLICDQGTCKQANMQAEGMEGGGGLLDRLGSNLNSVFGDNQPFAIADGGGATAAGAWMQLAPNCDESTQACQEEWKEFTQDTAKVQAAVLAAGTAPYAAYGGVSAGANFLTTSTWGARILQGVGAFDTIGDGVEMLVSCVLRYDPGQCSNSMLLTTIPGVGGWWDEAGDLLRGVGRGVGGVVDGFRVPTIDTFQPGTYWDIGGGGVGMRTSYADAVLEGDITRYFSSERDHIISAFISKLVTIDPRLPVYYDPSQGSPTDFITLYKGINNYDGGAILPGYLAEHTNDGYQKGLGFSIVPGSAAIIQHSLLGETYLSPYSSWTSDFNEALRYAGAQGAVISNEFHPSDVVGLRQAMPDLLIEDYLRGVSSADLERYMRVIGNNVSSSIYNEYLYLGPFDPSNGGVGAVDSLTRQSVLVELNRANPLPDERITARMVNDHVSSLGSSDEYGTIAQVVNDILPPYASSNQELIAAGADRARSADEVMLCSTTWCRHNTKVTNEVLQERGEDVYQVFVRFSDGEGNQHSHVLSAVNKDGQWIYVDPTVGQAFYSTEDMTQIWLDQKGYSTLSIVATDIDTFEEVAIR